MRPLLAVLLALASSPHLASARVVHGVIDLPDPRPEPGRLVVWWTADGPTAGSAWDQFIQLIPRFAVLSADNLTARSKVHFILKDLPDTPVTVHALYDTAGRFWAGALGGGNASRGSASATQAVARITLAPPPTREPRPEYCAGPRFRLEHLAAPYVAGKIGNPTRRRLCVYLPPSYRSASARRYPVVYLLPGLASTDRARLDGDVRVAADALKAEAILVAIDTSTVSGSTYFVNSTISGEWMRFLRAAVAHIDATFRTRADARYRAVIGQSTGGFNAVSLGLRAPDLFTVVGASAPDGLDLEGWLTEVRGQERFFKPRWLTWMRLEARLALPDGRQQGQFISYAADWSRVWPLFWPADLKTGRVEPAVWAKWRAQSPLVLLEDAKRRAAVRTHLDGRIFLAVARGDEFGLYPPTKAFSDALTRHGIDHTFVASDGGHGDGEDERLRDALAFALRVMRAR